ncbi:hypothetical protein EXU85_03605 [Spirosoma sp. KCTC 42546]|uniref:hypothetical protein n=1 Tax=Spirosoma sp. KCTC 42546 TaxID=2520506 RepID=UPI001156CC42|nr:hypothetical protein [Spirosoma sp. KCTC 42546]QDK77728.1 hypothetical protein EXU85_03605 [Spirosoma sp. KCTC 42546]
MGSDQGTYNPFIQFLTTLLIGFVFLPIQVRSASRYSWFWWKIALAFVIVGIIAFLGYQSFKVNHSIEYPKRSNNYKINGNTLTPLAQKKMDQGEAESIEVLLEDAAGDARLLWPMQEIRSNTIILLLLYGFCQFSFTIGIITLLQAIDCHLKKEPTEDSSPTETLPTLPP